MVVALASLYAALFTLAAVTDTSAASTLPADSSLASSLVDLAASTVPSAVPSTLNNLNATVGGRLKAAIPFESPCFSTVQGHSVPIDPAACAEIQASYTDPTFRVKHFGAYMLVSSHITSPERAVLMLYSHAAAVGDMSTLR